MNIIERIRERSSEFASNVAVIEGEERWTHAEMWDRVDRLSNGLAELGVEKGRLAMAWLPNAHEALEAELACLQIGAIWVTINSRFTWGEAVEVIEDCGPDCFITDPQHLKLMSGDAAQGFPVIVTGEEERPGAQRVYEKLIAESRPERPKVAIDDDDIARLRYTSGTTGKVKAAILPHRVYQASLDNLRDELHPLGPDDRVLHGAPMTHASGAMMYPILAAGGANVIAREFNAGKALEAIERERVTTMFVAPTMLQRMTGAAGFAERDLSSLRTIMYGGAPMSVKKLEPAIERLGQALVHIYGMTEAPYPITTLRREEHWIGNPRLGSIGRPTKICELRVVDEAGADVPEGEVGELLIRGRNVMRGYWRDEEETRRVLNDGWLASGDLGLRDNEGYYRIVDRKKDVIISGGFNVYAKEVELKLCEYDGVSEVAVAGLPHPDWGEMVTAFVVATEGAEIDGERIKAWCRERLAGYKCPKLVKIVEDLPKNPSGKIDKKSLIARGN